MRKFLTFLPLLIATLALTGLPQEAEAKRMGFGKSMGRQYSAPQKSVQPAPAAPTSGAAPRPGSRWFGPIAGLLAGGLLASLFFGGAFDGLRMMDFVLIALLAFAAFMVLRALRPRPAVQLRTAAGPALGDTMAPGFGSGAPETLGGAPAWFNAGSFIEAARTHFIRLQAAWDKGDMQDIAEYTTPELYAALQAERLSRGEEKHFTEVAYLDAELAGTHRDGDQVVASVRFVGGIREERDAPVEKFTELWHVVHGWESSAGTWLVAGIQQQETY